MENDPRDVTHRVRHATDTGLLAMFGMAALMMACCIAILLLVALIPAFGWPVGFGIGIAAGAVLLYLHFKFMRHGAH